MQVTSDIAFEEQQQFRQAWLWALMVGILIVVLAGLAGAFLFAPADEDRHDAILGLAVGAVMVVGGAVLMYALKLTVKVEGAHLHIHFFPLVKRTIPLEQIRTC